MREHTRPTITQTEFHCPYCGVYTQHVWFQLAGKVGSWQWDIPPQPPHLAQPKKNPLEEKSFRMNPIPGWDGGKPYAVVPDASFTIVPQSDKDIVFDGFYASVCVRCRRETIWHNATMLCPTHGGVESPNADLNEEIRSDYNEAAAIVSSSPRGAAALLRLCIQKLCMQLGFPGKDLNVDIGALVKKGLDSDVQKALDALRVIGNNAVHPLEMDLRDDHETATRLFAAVNFIAQQMITQRQKIGALFGQIPEGAKSAITKRDK